MRHLTTLSLLVLLQGCNQTKTLTTLVENEPQTVQYDNFLRSEGLKESEKIEGTDSASYLNGNFTVRINYNKLRGRCAEHMMITLEDGIYVYDSSRPQGNDIFFSSEEDPESDLYVKTVYVVNDSCSQEPRRLEVQIKKCPCSNFCNTQGTTYSWDYAETITGTDLITQDKLRTIGLTMYNAAETELKE
ncbi:MAG: hypothetical protein WC254_01090 [Candidatus Woesearchaeota archaeon]|jgi:hypothetical protein